MSNNEIIEFLKTLNIYKSKLSIYLKNHFPKIYDCIFKNTKFIDDNNVKNRKITFAERVYCIENNITTPVLCKECKKNFVKFKADSRKYADFCSVSCTSKNADVIQLKQNTCLEKYGTPTFNNYEKRLATIAQHKKENPTYVEDIKHKRAMTNIKNGHDLHWNNHKKYVETSLRLYGTDHPSKNENIKRRRIENFAKKHDGITCALHLPESEYKTKFGIRQRAYKYILNSDKISPMFSLDEFIKVKNINDKNSLRFKCKKCGTEFLSNWDNGICKPCPICNPELHGTSLLEQNIATYIQSLDKNIKVHNKEKINNNILCNKKQVDIIAENNNHKLLIEFDGLYHHSYEIGKNKYYHLNKTKAAEDLGYQLIHIFENEWLSKPDIVKSRIKNLLGIYDKKIFARKCCIKEVQHDESKIFQNENHIQGFSSSKVNLGLFYFDELIALMTFNKSRFNKKYQWELIRFCNKTGWHIPGAASKLLTYFEKKYKPATIISYADRRWSQGKLYEALGFKLDHASAPNYWYFKPSNPSILYNRIKFQKHKLKNQLESFDSSKSEIENMHENGYYRIFDCGNLVYVKKLEN